MIFFMFAMFIFHPALKTGYMNNIAKNGMIFAEWIIFGFSILFILYSLSTFLKTRKKELSLSLFIGLFIAIIFFMVARSFLYFRLFADLYEERKKYTSLAKIGLSEKEMVKNATIQMALLFFMPFLLAIIETGFALHVLQREGGYFYVFQSGVATILGFLALQMIYFIVMRSSFIKNLKEYVYRT